MSMQRQLRSDLVITELPDDAGCKVFDPLTEETYEFGPVEQFLIHQFQGGYSAQEVGERCNARFGTTHAASDIEDFLGLLSEWGLLAAAPGADVSVAPVPEPAPILRAEPDQAPAQDFRQPNRWHLFAPTAWLDGMLGALAPLRVLVWLTPLALALGALVVIFNLKPFLADVASASNRFGLAGRLALAAFTVNFLSQLARGVVARHFGMTTPSFGFVLLFGLIPRFNMQIVPAGSMSRESRMWLAATSSLVRFWLFGLTMVVWGMSRASGSSLSGVAIEIGQLSLVGLLFVANPLWRGGDGANFLSAWLDTPNVQQRWRASLTHYFVRQPAVVSRYQKPSIMLGLLGLAVLVLFVTVLGFVAYKVFTFMEHSYQGAGVALFLGLAGYIAYNVRRQSLAKQSKSRARQAEAAQAAHPSWKTAVAAANDSPRRVPWLRYLLLIGFIICLFLPYHYETGGPAEVLPNAKATITPEMDGTVEAIHFNGGEWVEAGTVIAQIADYRQSNELQQIEADLMAKKFEIQRLRTTPSQEALDLAQQQVKTARIESEYSDAKHLRQKQLFADGFVSAQALEDARNIAERDRQRLVEAEASLASLRAQINPNQIAELEAEVVKLQRAADLYREQQRRASMRSPIAGRIITKDLKFHLNAFFEAGKMFAEVEDTRTVLLRVAVPESDVGELAVGAPMAVKLWSYPDRQFEGKVSEIQPATEESDYGRVVYATGRIDNPKGLLVSGMTGQAKVEGQVTVVALAFTKALIRFVTIEVWSWLP